MPSNLDPETLRAVETEMTRLMQPEEGTGRYLDGAETWNRLLTWIRLRCVPPASGAALAEAAPQRQEARARLSALVHEWQEARKPARLAEPGVDLVATYQAAVQRMAAADEALAAYDLNGTAGAFAPRLAGQTVPTASAGTSLRDELTDIIRWRFKSADGKSLHGPSILKRAQEIAGDIAPMIEEATGER